MLFVLVAMVVVGCSSDPLEEARALHAQGRYEEALEPLRGLVEARTDDPEVFYLYGVSLASTRQITQAFWPLRRAMESPEWYDKAALQLAQLAVGTTDWDLANRTLDEMLERDPDNKKARVLRAYARAQSRQDYEGSLADADVVLAEDPEHSDALVLRGVALLGLGRVDEAGEAIEAAALHFDEVGLGLAGSARYCVVRATFAKEKEELERAAEIFEECLEQFPGDLLVVDESAKFYDGQQNYERSLEIIRTAFEAAPDMLPFRLTLSQRLAAIGEIEEAEQLLVEATQVDDRALAASGYADLAAFYFRLDNVDGAVSAFEQALARLPNPGPEFLFTYADVLVASGRYDEALALTERMALPAHRELVAGRVALAQGDPAKALDHFTEGQRLWPNNAVARYFAATAAEQVGDFDRAIEEYRYSIRTDASSTDARVRLARLYVALGEPEQALQTVRHEVGQRLDAVPPLEETLLELEILGRLGRVGPMPPRLRNAIREPTVWPSALAALARGLRVGADPATAARLVEEADRLDLTRVANAPALWSLCEDLVTLDREAEAVAHADAALKAHPRASTFWALRGFLLEAVGANAAIAREAWDRAVALGPKDPVALRGLAASHARGESHDEALALYARATEADPKDVLALLATAEILAETDRGTEAEAALRQVLERDPYHAAAPARLARLMADRGVTAEDPDMALQLRRSARFGSASERSEAARRLDAVPTPDGTTATGASAQPRSASAAGASAPTAR